MGTLVTGQYQGQKRFSVTHDDSGVSFFTDAPKDNNGLGTSFSPTDLVGTALATCILTTIAIVADRDGLSMDGMRFKVVKEMTADKPRKIGSLNLELFLPATIPESERARLEAFAKSCPVHRALNPDVSVQISFSYTA